MWSSIRTWRRPTAAMKALPCSRRGPRNRGRSPAPAALSTSCARWTFGSDLARHRNAACGTRSNSTRTTGPAYARAQLDLDGLSRVGATAGCCAPTLSSGGESGLVVAMGLLRQVLLSPETSRQEWVDWAQAQVADVAEAARAEAEAMLPRLRAALDAGAAELGRVLPRSALAADLGDQADVPFVLDLARALAAALVALDGLRSAPAEANNAFAPVAAAAGSLATAYQPSQVSSRLVRPERRPGLTFGEQLRLFQLRQLSVLNVRHSRIDRGPLGSVDWYSSWSEREHPYIQHYPVDPRRLNVFLGEPGGDLPMAVLDQARADLTVAPPGQRIRFTVFADRAVDTEAAVSALAASYPHAEVIGCGSRAWRRSRRSRASWPPSRCTR